MALLTLEDLEAVMGRASRPFTDDEAGTAQFIIDRIEAYILTACPGLAFEETEATVRRQADYYGVLELDEFPIIDIESVVNVRTGNETYWEWDDFNIIYDLDPYETVDISLTYGYAEAPADLVSVAKSMAYREMSNPLGIRQQTVGAISETYAAMALSSMDEEILRKYGKDDSYSIRVSPSQVQYRTRRLPTL